MQRSEFVTAGDCDGVELAPGVLVRVLVAGAKGSEALTVCTATVRPGAELPYHTHPTSEVILAVAGKADALVEGRRYRLTPYDAIHVPAGVPHSVQNATGSPCVLHTSFPTSKPDREFVEPDFEVIDCEASDESVPETVTRFEGFTPEGDSKEVLTESLFDDSVTPGFSGRLLYVPARSMSIGKASRSDRAITALDGRAMCGVLGREYDLNDCDTLGVPAGRIPDTANRNDESLTVVEISGPRHASD